MKKQLLIFTLLLLQATVARSENDGKWRGVWDSENRHSVSFSVGYMPIMRGFYSSQESTLNQIETANNNPNYYDYYVDETFSTPTFSASYFYRFCKEFSVGCSIGYGYESNKLNFDKSDKYAFTSCDNVLLISPMVRLHWLNTKYVELYSELGLIGYGVAFSTNAEHIEGYSKSSDGNSMQFTPIGLSAKFNRTYIFSELGLGTLGLFRFGVGYRF